MTGVFLGGISFAGYCLFFIEFFCWPGASLPLFLISSLTLLLYMAAFLGALIPAVNVLAWLGAVLGVAALTRILKNRQTDFSRFIEPGLLMFFLAAIILWPVLAGSNYASWDEFSHWGFAAKEFFMRGALPGLESALRFKEYPPGTALFQYYTLFFTGWSEGATFFAQALILLASATALLRGCPWKQFLRATSVMAFAYLLLPIFGYKLQSLYVDHVIGFMFGAAIASSLLGEKGENGVLIRALPTLLILPLIKSAGLLLALIAGAVIVSNHFIAIASGPADNKSKPGRALPMALCIALLAGPVLAAKSWDWHVTRLDFKRTFQTEIKAAEIKKSLSDTASERDKITLHNFKKALISKRIGASLPPLPLVLLLCIISFILTRMEKRRTENLQSTFTFLWLISGFTVYTAGLVMLYLYSFGPYEGPRLASFGRYMGIFFTGWSMATAALLLRQPSPSDKWARFYRMAAWLTILASVICIIAAGLKKKEPANDAAQRRIREMASYAISTTPDNASIYLIWQASDGFEALAMAYELAPRHTSIDRGPWSLGKPYSTGDIWTTDLSAADWGKDLENYDFVLLGRAGPDFFKRYRTLFTDSRQDPAKFLFKISGEKNQIKLLPV